MLPLPSDPELARIARTFYDKVYAHPWIGRFFDHIDQSRQEIKLVRFLRMAWHESADAEIQGRYLEQEHAHMRITGALFDLRQTLLAEALREHAHPEPLVQAFLAFNERWRRFVVSTHG